MNVEATPTVGERVDLPDTWNGWSIPKIQRVAIGALALETRNPAPISLLIGVEEKEVKVILEHLLRNGWDTMASLEEDQLNERADMTMNENFFPILKKHGVEA